MMTSWNEKFNSRLRGHQLLFHSKTCHYQHEQRAESISSAALYMRFRHLCLSHLSVHIRAHLSAPATFPEHPAATKPRGTFQATSSWQIKPIRSQYEITHTWLWGVPILASSARGFLRSRADRDGHALDQPSATCMTFRSNFKICFDKPSKPDALMSSPVAGCPSQPPPPRHVKTGVNKVLFSQTYKAYSTAPYVNVICQ